MPSIANNNKSSSNRRNTFGGEGVENAVNKKKPSRQSISGGDQQQQQSSNSKVRWNVPKTTTANTTNNNNLNTSISTNHNMTPSKRVVDKFVNVASGKEKDVVRNYHFEGTPFASSKKKRRKHHSSSQQQNIANSGVQNGGGEYTASLSAANAIDNSFQLNNDTTAEILKMATASNNTSIALDPLDESLLSAASTSTASSSSSVDPLTLSDTHELSTSNFIQSTKMRGLLANRAKELYGNKDGGDMDNGDKGKKLDSVWEKPFGGNNLAGKKKGGNMGDNFNTATATAVGERQISNSFSSLIDGIGLEASSTLTLPDLTMNVTGVLHSIGEQQQERLAANQEEDEEDSEILEFTSHQKSRTPRKSPSRELSMLNSTSDDTTRSVGGLDSMLANFDDDDEGGKQVANKGKKEATMTTDLSKLIEESAKIMADGEEGGVKRRSGETSFVESTVSQGDLANLLNDDDEEVEDSGKAKNQTSESTPLAASNNGTASTPNSSGLCPSPSFLSGKKQRGSGIPTLRKSLGGDVTKIRKLTASLRKEKKSKKRMSLPALAMSKQPPGGGRLSMDVMVGTESENKAQESPPTKAPPKSPELANSPARNTRSAKKSPKKSPAVDSPARNTRGSAKKSPRKSPAGSKRSPKRSPLPPADSPARNNRGAKKKSPVPPSNNSPARNTRGARKSPMKSPGVDSPARNTRSARRSASPKHSSSAPSPARSLFNSPPDENEPTSTSSTSLSKEYPFLSLSPKENVAEGTQTLMFGELMQGIENEVSKKNSSLDNEEEDSGEIVVNAKHSSRNKRRDTADTADLMGILSDVQDEDESPKATTATNKKNSPHTPSGGAMASGATSKTPKGILSSIKKRGGGGTARPRGKVGFGSPEAAEYNVGSPSVSMTPMNPEAVREQFTMPEEEEQTAELENDLERLISKGNDTSILMDPIDELDGSKDVSGSSSEGGMSFAGAEKTAELETNMFNLVNNPADESAFSLPSLGSVSTTSNRSRRQSNDTSHEDMSMVEPTQTIELEGTVASLLGDQNNKSRQTEDSQTMQLEGTLASLLFNRPDKDNNENDVSFPSSCSSTSTPPVRNDGNDNMMNEDSHTMNIEGTMASLLDAAPDNNNNNAGGEATTHSQTMPLDSNLEVLLKGADGGNNRHMSDDTISELGMNTASHELRQERELSRCLARKEVAAAAPPPEPVDLKLEEIVNVGSINWDQKMETNQDTFLQALIVASGNTYPSVKPESEKFLATICDEIEGQLQSIDNDSHFMQTVQNNEELMRSLQQQIRAGTTTKDQARLRLQAEVESQFSEWNKWLTNVTDMYSNVLEDETLPQLQEDKADITNKSTLIDQNREQVALPLLIRSARRQTKRNFERTKGEVSNCMDEVSELEAQVEEAERQLESLQSTHEIIHQVSKSNEKSEGLIKDERGQRQTADSSYFKFFSIEKLHNWVLTGSSDSSISIVFRGLAAETSIQLSFTIDANSKVSLKAKFGTLPRSTNSFLSNNTGVKQTRFHPAVSGFLKSKMDLLCQDMKRSRLSTPSEISSLIHFAELRVARIEQAAKEIDSILGQCKNSFLQPSDLLQDGYDFTAYLSSTTAGDSRKGDRLNMTLSIPDCYPFGVPISVSLNSTSSSFDTESITRQLKKAIKPGYYQLSRVVEEAKRCVS